MRWPSDFSAELLRTYDFKREIGAGNFAKVWLTVHKQTGMACACKVINKKRHLLSAGLTKIFEREISIMKQLKHENIVPLHELHIDGDRIHIFMEYIEGGDLFTYLSDNGPFSESGCRPLFKQTCSAIRYLHANGITHRDIKLDNMLIKVASNGTVSSVKLADFGLARAVGDGETMRTICGTPSYLAPEIVCRSSSTVPYSKSVDMWALGVVLYALHMNSFPFSKALHHGGAMDASLEMYSKACRMTATNEKFCGLSSELQSLLVGLLQICPEQRLTIEAAIHHPWTQTSADGAPGPLQEPVEIWGMLKVTISRVAGQKPSRAEEPICIDLFRGRTVIGRGRTSHIQIPDPKISSSHCEVLFRDSLIHLRNTGRSPCWVDGHPVNSGSTQVLKPPFQFSLWTGAPKPSADGAPPQRAGYQFRVEVFNRPWKVAWTTSSADLALAEVLADGRALVVNHSSNGTFVNAQRVEGAVALETGDEIVLLYNHINPHAGDARWLGQEAIADRFGYPAPRAAAGLRTAAASHKHAAQDAGAPDPNSGHQQSAVEDHRRILEKYAESQRILDKYSVMPGKSSDYMALLQRITDENLSDTRRPREPLVLKRISDSFTETYLLFRDNLALREEYINSYGDIRLGKVLEDLDRLAGAVAYKHASDANGDLAPVVFVTASVDRIDLKSRLCSDRNYRLSGTVTYVGFSSMEIFIQIQAMAASGETANAEPVLVARFTMVGRDKYTGKSAQVNPLLLEDESQRRLTKISEQIKEHKKALAEANLRRQPPSAEERLAIHQLWLETEGFREDARGAHTSLPENMVWLDKTTMESVTVCFPSERNVHNKIFGGYLMRLAHELSFANGSVFTKSRPVYVSLDDFSFRKPVNIGSILKLTSQIVYSEPEHGMFRVEVEADVIDNLADTMCRTNTFYFNFSCPDGSVPRVIPRSYGDMMKYLEGRRRTQTDKLISRLQSAMQGQGSQH
ncbi:hypothetical protein LPJ61_003427 [Coemansia biformis]|uniref:Pkinase-domain-containing protein n=1 Tax=Coemansia biformis TaxID=1286918 RepID=A0A9W8CXP6_9FUNG|nr:hypothetical protein LPJ61_003427 [Coemansia biformis]